MENSDRTTLILEIPYAGLGDHLFHSHLPEIAKKDFGFHQVLISNHSPVRHPDYQKLVWESKPFVDGFTEARGITCSIEEMLKIVDADHNLLDRIMQHYGLDNGSRWNEPKIYYTPKFREEFACSIYDPNYLSWVGNVDRYDAMVYFKTHGFTFDKVMSIRSEKCLYVPADKTQFCTTPTLFDFCDLIHSSKRLYCLTSGTATIAAALGKAATVFYGAEQDPGFRHSKLHHYLLIQNSFWGRLRAKFSRSFGKHA